MIPDKVGLFRLLGALEPSDAAAVAAAAVSALSPIFAARFPLLTNDFERILERCSWPEKGLDEGVLAKARELAPDSEDCLDGGPALFLAHALVDLVELCMNPSAEDVLEVLESAYEIVEYNEKLRLWPEQLLAGQKATSLGHERKARAVAATLSSYASLLADLLAMSARRVGNDGLLQCARTWATQFLVPISVPELRKQLSRGQGRGV